MSNGLTFKIAISFYDGGICYVNLHAQISLE